MKLPQLYPILDTATLAARDFPVVDAAHAMLDGGATLLQFRHKGQFPRSVFEQVEDVADLCRHYEATLVVNDRADIARLIDAALHLGQDDLPPTLARRILLPGAMMGLSTHNRDQIRDGVREPVDYLALGPIFPTGSKEKPDPEVGLASLKKWRDLSDLPVVGIGGITLENAPAVLQAGADSVAVISALIPDDCTSDSIRKRMEAWLRVLKT